MLFLYTLLFLALIAAAIFASPLRAKVWTAFTLTAAGALWHGPGPRVLAGGTPEAVVGGRLPLGGIRDRWTPFRRSSRC